MWQIFVRAVGIYAPYILAPAAFTIGFIGYNLEWMIRSSDIEKDRASVIEDRYNNELKVTENDANKVSLKDELYKVRPIFTINKSTNL